MQIDFAQLLINQGIAGIVLAWFMFKNSKDMEAFRNLVENENTQTREVIKDLKEVISQIGGVNK